MTDEGGWTSSGRLVEKIRLAFSIPDQQPSVPAATDLPASIANASHLLRIAVPVPPELCVGADFDGAHSVGDDKGLCGAHVAGSSSRPSL
jgi:hypothetical protein